MKTKTLNRSGFLKTMFFKTLIITAFLALAGINTSTAANTSQDTVYVQLEIQQNPISPSPFVIIGYADVYAHYYSDYSCTQPILAPVNETLYYSGLINDSVNGYSVQRSGAIDVVSGNSNSFVGQLITYYGDFYDYDCMFLRSEYYSSYEIESQTIGTRTYLPAPSIVIP